MSDALATQRSRHGSGRATRIVLAVFFLFSVILPVAFMGARLLEPSTLEVFSSPSFGEALRNSIVSALLGTIVSVALALVAALALTRTTIRLRGAWVVALTLPMLIPSIAHGMGLVYLFGSNGIVTNFLGASWDVYGLGGIVLGSILYAFPPAFLMLFDALKYENCVVYDAADILGIPKWSQFGSLTLPYLRRPLISAVFATFTLIITDYGVPIMVGGKFTTLSVLMYQNVIGQLQFGSGVAIGSILLIPAVAAFVVDLLGSSDANLGYESKGKRVVANRARDILARVFCGALVAFLVAPLVTFAIVAFVTKYPVDMTPTLANVNRSLLFGMGSYLLNSLVIAVAVSALGTCVAWLAAYVAARTPGAFGRALHLVCIVTLAIPGIVLGLAYMLFFKGSILYGTLAILVLVNLVHFFANPYLLAYNALSKLNANLEAVGQTLGIPRSRMIRDVFLPQTKNTVLEMVSYFFVNSMVTISAVSFLAGVAHMPLALLISDFDAQLLIECAALVALVIFVVNVVAKIALYVLRGVTLMRLR